MTLGAILARLCCRAAPQGGWVGGQKARAKLALFVRRNAPLIECRRTAAVAAAGQWLGFSR